MDTRESQAAEAIEPISFFLPLFGRWKWLAVFTFIGALTGLVASLVMPRIYQSRATLYARQSRAASVLSALPIAVSGVSGNSSSYYAVLLESDTMLCSVITRLNLTRRPEFSNGGKPDVEETMRRLKRCVDVKERRDGSVEILVRSRSPYLAARIANTMLHFLDRMVVTASRRKVAFISAKLEETMRDLRKAEDEMRRFQQSNDIALVDEQTKALIAEISALDGRLLALDVELEELSSRLATAGDLETLVNDEVRKRAVEASRKFVLSKRAELQERLAQLPEVAIEYARLQRRIAVLNKTFEVLTEHYQLERITQQGEDGDYQIIDRARPNKRKVSPRTAVNTGLGGALGFTLTALAISAFAPVRKYKKS